LTASSGEPLTEITRAGRAGDRLGDPHLANPANSQVAAVDPLEKLAVRVDPQLERQRFQILPAGNLDTAVLVDEEDFRHAVSPF
jgi:hypothetical protein